MSNYYEGGGNMESKILGVKNNKKHEKHEKQLLGYHDRPGDRDFKLAVLDFKRDLSGSLDFVFGRGKGKEFTDMVQEGEATMSQRAEILEEAMRILAKTIEERRTSLARQGYVDEKIEEELSNDVAMWRAFYEKRNSH